MEHSENDINYLNITTATKIFKIGNSVESPKRNEGCSMDSDMAAQALMQLRKGVHSDNYNEDNFSDIDTCQSDSQGTDLLSISFTDEPIDIDTEDTQSYSPDSITENGGFKSIETNEIPKKRWLQQWDSTQDLAQPINWGEDKPNNIVETENKKRPTVLVRIENGQEKEVSKSDMQVAMALVELQNSFPTNYNY